MSTDSTYPNQHPLDPLTPTEIEQARDIVDQGTEVTDETRFIEITLAEPSKEHFGILNERVPLLYGGRG